MAARVEVAGLRSCRARPTDSVTVTLGYGRTHAGRVGNGVGFDVVSAPDDGRALVRLGPRGRQVGAALSRWRPPSTHHQMDGRDMIRVGNAGRLTARTPISPRRTKQDHEPAHSLIDDTGAADRTHRGRRGQCLGHGRSTSTPASAAAPA